MKIVTVSNYFNHHQKPLSEALYKITQGQFFFVATSPMSEERKKMGWDSANKPSYVLDVSACKEDEDKALRVIEQADAVIWGDAPIKYVKNRLKKGKLTFRCTERIFKKGFSFKEYVPRAIKHRLLNWPCRKQFLLCMSAYAAGDYAKMGLYKGRAYKWGYFTETKQYDLQKLLDKKRENKEIFILWTARMIPLKHPEHALYVAERLKNDGYKFQMKFIGDGELITDLQHTAENKHLDEVAFLGSMTPEEVRNYMEKANIFMFTSDQNEGWGAVVNEAMNSGCAVVANNAIGSVPYLIEHGKNGLIYDNGDICSLYANVKSLCDNQQMRETLGIAAYKTITDEWNAENAAHLLVDWVSNRQQRIPIGSNMCGVLEKES